MANPTLWARVRPFVIFILFAGCVAFSVFCADCQGPSDRRTVDLENTVELLRERDRESAKTIGRLESAISEQRKDFDRRIGELDAAAGRAGSLVRDALDTVDRLAKLSGQIEN